MKKYNVKAVASAKIGFYIVGLIVSIWMGVYIHWMFLSISILSGIRFYTNLAIREHIEDIERYLNNDNGWYEDNTAL